MAQRHWDAVHIIDPGACNPPGILRSMVAACDEIMSEPEYGKVGTPAIEADPALKLMVLQLAWVMHMPCDFPSSGDGDNFANAMDFCRKAAGLE